MIGLLCGNLTRWMDRYRDTDEDGVADEKKYLLNMGQGSRSREISRASGFGLWNLDNHITSRTTWSATVTRTARR